MRNTTSPLSGVSVSVIDELEARYHNDPASVDPGWRAILDVLEELDVHRPQHSDATVQSLLAAFFRQYGHLSANLDPLGLQAPATIADLSGGLKPHMTSTANAAFVERLKSIYCGTLAVESGHIDQPALREWIYDTMERSASSSSAQGERETLERLVTADEFERFMGVKFPGKKRFGAEGAEALIPLLDRILRNAASADVTDVIIGTMHRGRLNASANVFGKPLDRLFAEFKGMHPVAAHSSAAADVPYHLGHEALLAFGERTLRVTVSANPSHLEAINPVILGRVRARQSLETEPRRVLGVLLHTDASVIGQGLVSEMLQLSGVDGFATGGTIHVVINNQIGFTTERHEARTSHYCSGLWKAVDSLIVHVNGDDPDAVLRAADLAVDYRQTHARDAVIDLVCYRRNGHNEVDEPRFTQPVIYRAIENHPSVAEQFTSKLLQRGVVSAAEIGVMKSQARARLEQAFESAADLKSNQAAVSGVPRSDTAANESAGHLQTGVSLELLAQCLAAVSAVPPDMAVNQKVARIVGQRAQSATTGVSWAVGEALAFAAMLSEGTPVRLSGQDSVRGAFSQRHLALIDAQSGERRVELASQSGGTARFEAINSPLSEYAVLGFEYGYSVERPDAFVAWEAQFGDFANGAQIMIDQFIASGEEKWGQSSGLVMLLPHGLEGQGPEHSSGRLERFLQLCAQNNLQIMQPTTPANYFHALRRQVRGGPRKPLVVMTAKSLLRHPAAVSPATDFGPDSAFRPVIASVYGPRIERVLICSGKVAYDLERAREAHNVGGVAIVRLECLYPFPIEMLVGLFKEWRGADFAWVQEEPRNAGAWSFLDRRLEAVLELAGVKHARASCVSRPESASPAGSFHGNHDEDQRHLVERAFAWATERAEKPCTI